MTARIPIFVSSPSVFSAEQQKTYDSIVDILRYEGLEPRSLGKSDFPASSPIEEVTIIAKHCSGGVILGFVQSKASTVVFKPGTSEEILRDGAVFPTPWNQLEAGILFGMGLPLMVLCESGIAGGVFDKGAAPDIFLQNLPLGGIVGERR